MRAETIDEASPQVQQAIMELQHMIAERWPEASFIVSRGEDPEGIYLDVIVDIEDPDEVMDLVVDRLLELQVEDRLPIHVIPLQPRERSALSSRPYAATERK